jgi:adenosylhomocysteine nucleosidase
LTSKLTPKSICILGAVRQEISGLKSRMQVEEHLRIGKSDLWRGTLEDQPIILVRTGIGKKNAVASLTSVAERFPLRMILSIGYAGGLDPDLDVGDLLIADIILEAAGNPSQGPFLTSWAIDPALVARAMALPVRQNAKAARGRLLTVEQVVTHPELKQKLYEQTGALAVDMESSALVDLAQERQIPFLSIRAISDTANQELLDVSPFVSPDGEVSTLKAGWYVVTHPGSLKPLNTIRQHASRATNVLTDFVSRLILAAD